MMGREGRKPVDGQVMCPDDQDGEVDWKYAEHENEDRVDVIVEIIMSPRPLCLSVIKSRCTKLETVRGKLTVSLANRNARVHVASSTMQASRYAN